MGDRERCDEELPGTARVTHTAHAAPESGLRRLEEMRSGHRPPPLEGDDDPMRPDQVDDLAELLEWAPREVKERQFAETRLVSDHANDGEPTVRLGPDLLDQLAGQEARPQDQHAL